MKYKVGDKVRIKSIDWYNENKDENGIVELSTHVFIPEMVEHCGTIVTIKDVFEDLDDNVVYYMEEIVWDWTDEMIEGLVEEETEPKFKVGDKVKWFNHTCNITSIGTDENTYIYLIKHDDYREDKTFAKWVPESELTFEDDVETKSIDFTIKATDTKGKVEVVIPEGYGYVVENDKLYFITKKKEYPKTYEECCEVLDFCGDYFLTTYDADSMVKNEVYGILQQVNSLTRLLICKSAYWKIAGEEMGLDKPWEPDWTNLDQLKYCIWVDVGEFVTMTNVRGQHILAFPTEEMRDAFYENFKEDIETCKELL